MSCNERNWGNGKVTKTSIKELKTMLVEAYKIDYEKIEKAQRKYASKPSSRMTSFALIGREGYIEGSIELDMTNGTFRFSIPENNHSVDDVQNNSRVYSKFMNFIRSIPTNGKMYGASVYYESEYTRDAAENYGGGSSVNEKHYGAWMPSYQKKMIKKRA